MTEQGKAAAEVTFTTAESTPSGNSYLKYCQGEKAGAPSENLLLWSPPSCHPDPTLPTPDRPTGRKVPTEDSPAAELP